MCRKERSGRNGEIAYRPLDVISDTAPIKTSQVSKGRLEDVAVKQIEHDSPETVKLIKYLAQQNVHNICSVTTMKYNVESGLFSTPCGIVTQDSIDEANALLVEIGDFVADEKYGSKKFAETAGSYLMLIPQKVGRKLDLEALFPDLSAVQQQKVILDSLQASLDQVKAENVPKAKKVKTPEEKVFATKLTYLQDLDEVRRIKAKYRKTNQSRHACSHLKIKKIWNVDIESEREAYHNCSVGNIMELYHGTRVSNVLSILRGGLVIPPSSSSHVTGRMFNDGLYFSDQSTKSLNYAYGYWGGKADSNCFMFLADVKMGRCYTPKSSYDGPFPKKGYDSVFAKAHVSGVYNNEMIVYEKCQASLKYLIEFSS